MKNALSLSLVAAAALCTAFITVPAEATMYKSKTTTYTSTSVSHSSLKKSEVRSVQARLVKRGYYKGEIDGIMGPKTVEALEDFQKACGLPATGKLTRATLKELDMKTTASVTAPQDIEPAAGDSTTMSEETIYVSRGNRGFSAAEFDAHNSTCKECTDGQYGNGGKPDWLK